MVRAIELGVALNVRTGHATFEQARQASADVRAHLVDRERRQAMPRANVIDAGGDGPVAIAERSIEIEENGADCHERDRSGRGGGSASVAVRVNPSQQDDIMKRPDAPSRRLEKEPYERLAEAGTC